MQEPNSHLSVNLEFYPITLPPVRDILVLGKKYPHGKVGIIESFRFIAPDEFEMFDVPDSEVAAEAVLINKKILQRMTSDEVIDILRQYVFPYITHGEAINVDFNLKVKVDSITVQRNI